MDEIQSLKAQLNNLLLRVSELESKVATLEKKTKWQRFSSFKRNS